MADTRQFNASFLDRTIDDIEDLASFEVPPNGTYALKVSTECKVVKDKDAVEASFEVVDTVELDDPTETPPKAGNKFSMLFFMDQEVAEGKLKQFLAPFAEAFGERNLGVLVLEKLNKDQGIVAVGSVKRRKDKEDPEKFYADVRNLKLA